jgi:hypothetical protein
MIMSPPRGREIGHDHVEPPAFEQVAADLARPARQAPRRPADQDLHRPLAAVPAAHLADDRAELRIGSCGPVGQLVEPGADPRHHRAFDGEGEVVPAVFSRRGEIAVLDVEAAEHRDPAVGDDDLLVVADQVTPRPLGEEAAERAPGLDQRGEEALVGDRAEAVDDQPHFDPAPRRRDERVAHAHRACVGGEDVEGELEAGLRAVDQPEQRRQAVAAAGIETERQSLRLDREGRRVAELGGGSLAFGHGPS